MAEFRCKAFLFDMDGVLVDSRAIVERTWRRWAAERHPIDLVRLLHVAHGRRARDTLLIMAPSLATDTEVAWLDATELADVEGLRVLGPDVLIVAEEVPRGKPAPDGYRLGAERLGYAPSACIVFEDAPAGVAAGKASGARVLALTTNYAPRDLQEAGADATIADLRSIQVHQEHDDLVVTVV